MEQMKSAEIHELATALAKAQGEMVVAGLNKVNPFFKSRYADWQSIIEASRPALTKNGLAVSQQIIQGEEGHSLLYTTLLHSSGQWISSKSRIVPAKNDIQGIASYVTYLKRMCYSSLIGVCTGDEDDDGELAVAPTRETQRPMTQKSLVKEESITQDQLDQLEYELQGYTDIASMVLDGLKIATLADMPKQKFLASLQRIRAIKSDRNPK